MRSSYIRVLFCGLLLLVACVLGISSVAGSKASGTTPFTPFDDSFTIHGGTVVSFVANDDFAGYTPYAVIVDAPSHGTISGGSLYVPDNGYTGTDTFTYHLCLTECSITATVTLSVVNSAPVINGDVYLVPPYPGALCINLTKYAYDPESDSFYDVEFLDLPDNGWITGGSCGKTYHANSSFFGADSFTYKLCDVLGACSGAVTTWVFVDYYYGSGTCPAPPVGSPNHPIAPENIAKPINVTSGNMWLAQTDYSLPGVGENIEVERYYNTWAQFAGLFGKGWTTQYDESIVAGGSTYSGRFLRLTLPDATRIQFGRASTSDPFKPLIAGLRGQIVLNGDGTYTLTFKDGRIHQFDSAGKLLWQKDHNGNQTTLTYTSGVLSSVTDPFSRTLTFTTNGNGNVTAIADSTGTIANYEYHTGTTRLKKVTYPDNSEFNFEYQIIGSNGFLSSVTDAYDNVLEAHTYHTGSGQALTSEVHGGEEEYTINYASSGQTIVTDGLGHETTYYFDAGRGAVTSIVGACGCGSSGSETTTFTYDERLNVVKKVDALSNETTYTYDIDGNLTSITDPIGTQE